MSDGISLGCLFHKVRSKCIIHSTLANLYPPAHDFLASSLGCQLFLWNWILSLPAHPHPPSMMIRKPSLLTILTLPFSVPCSSLSCLLDCQSLVLWESLSSILSHSLLLRAASHIRRLKITTCPLKGVGIASEELQLELNHKSK